VVEGGLEEPELEDPPVDVEPEEPEELVGALEDPEELVGGLEEPEELVGGLEVDGGGARRSSAELLVEFTALHPVAIARRLKRATNRIRILCID